MAPLLDSLGLGLPSFLEMQCPATSDYLTTGQPLPATPCASARLGKIGVRVPIHQFFSFSRTHTQSFTNGKPLFISRHLASIVLVLDSGLGAWPHLPPAFPSVSQQAFSEHLPAWGWHCIMKNGQRSTEGTMEGKKAPKHY